jgi:hypothetical protein
MIHLAILVNSSTGQFMIWPIAGAAAGLYLFYRGFDLLQRKRLILNTPQSKIRSASMGLVEVSGLATGPYALLAPVTARPCYYYRTMVWQWERKGKNTTWVKKVDESLHVPFYLDDNTGRVLVNPQGADLDIHCDFKEEFRQSIFSGNRGTAPDNITNFLLMHGIDSEKKIKIEEYCIKPKNSLFVLGTLAHNPGLEVTGTAVQTIHGSDLHTSGNFGGHSLSFSTSFFGASPNSAAISTAMSHTTTHPALDKAKQDQIAAAMMKAGITNPAAWAAVGLTPLATVASAVSTPAGTAAAPAPALEQFDLHPATVLMKGTHDHSFLISWKSQRELVGTLNWKSALMIWGGPALTVLSAYFFALQIGWL